ncbi:poly-gamma-glutamate hydrolase family protein [Staphylococcus cohnii]|uniref:Poly-gamma-glutamate hydrolase family protein n=2 Tax=Staphylococcus cohnii TaxID=29382 RepID=A0ABT6J252_9STAP|nr:poly-gamma-glutamate hydrolase family protein [Staphylococcus cohnii]TGP60742.1 hypothetical protein EN872_09580 [bacterium M00.F.Ca.ET.229.01.1.1]TGS37627.1 hypothetical protein EN823_09575 [bacterium M00.F.Ca.ET.180.01.1.1]AYX89699.1 hypothetical protein EGX68_05355 [Staphylococcus cohnii]KKI64032.1 hypothetical protein UF66_0229 [Staphylococcus cohnii subsp. cohnii]MDE1710390.1 poly-gamma-glutamate hydrolase family protein [Staphylococcus cohnii]
MVDHFATMKELLTYTHEGEDWEIQMCERDSPVLITAVHGGAIERGTTEIAQYLSEIGDFSFYSFKGVRKNKNNELHVTSTHFDEPNLKKIVSEHAQVISIHGCMGEKNEVYIGGRDEALITRIKQVLNEAGIIIKDAPSHIAGKQQDNFVNCGKKGMGVQLELTVNFRKHCFVNKKFNLKDREDRSNWSTYLKEFSKAMVNAITYHK